MIRQLISKQKYKCKFNTKILNMGVFIIFTCVVMIIFAQLNVAYDQFDDSENNCCQPHPSKSCSDPKISSEVCSHDTFCCLNAWDTSCVLRAYAHHLCPIQCGDGFCQGNETCVDCPHDCGECEPICSHSFINTTLDPLFPEQWHLHNTGSDNHVNATGAWDHGLSGRGVQIAIVDDGVQWQHEDLSCNFNMNDSYSFSTGEHDPVPGFQEKHGTSCAGVAAARDNDVCGVGVAPRAIVAGIKVIDAEFTDSRGAQSLGYHLSSQHIYSNSWGSKDSGHALESTPLSVAAIQHGALYGRDGLGAVYVWAGGNGRRQGDNSNYDPLANSIYTIAVAASDNTGGFSGYSEPGTNILVNAPSNGMTSLGVTFSGIVTTDRLGVAGYSPSPCTKGFGGTSSAAPLVAGVVALILEANPRLSYRDVQHILVHTSDRNMPAEETWQQNAAGLYFSPNYGFGRVNAGQAVVAAQNWKRVPPMISLSLSQNISSPSIPSDGTKLSLYFPVSQSIIVEQVTVFVDVQHPSRGQVVISVESPSGTLSMLAPGRSHDWYSDMVWTFSSVELWGEHAQGEWKVTIHDKMDDQSQGTLNSIRLGVYGYESSWNSSDSSISPSRSSSSSSHVSSSSSEPSSHSSSSDNLSSVSNTTSLSSSSSKVNSSDNSRLDVKSAILVCCLAALSVIVILGVIGSALSRQ
eukprot:gb/GECH01009389.1/.p1 GENE.gb/GECH01009389.1/~~gb/GECH01009389.1/.p1  ORF type:complete len:689 (+),score=115.93 gb/GECH01009389.1/:1-2067(+)